MAISDLKYNPNKHWSRVKWKGAEKGFQRELEFAIHDKVKQEILSIFAQAQDDFVHQQIPDCEAPMMPFITGNLHDSIVGVVSDNGMMVKASYANRVAVTISPKSGKQIYTPSSGGGRKRIIGHQEAWKAVYGMQGKYPRRIAASLFVAVPYALRPEEKGPHKGYLENLRYLYAAAMDSEFRRAAARHVIEWKGNMDNYMTIAYDPEDERLIQPIRKRGRKKGSGSGYMGSARPGMSMKMKP